MTQNRDTGAEAARFGHEVAALIGEKIGAKKLTRNSNEFELNGKRVTIRTAHQATDQVGVLYSMLQRVQAVIAAFEAAPNEFELHSITPEIFQTEMRDSNTGGGRVGLVRKKVFLEKGTFVATVKIAPIADAEK
jgi:hypothetical protein